MTLIDKAEALLPCPFCGGEAEWKSGGPGCAWISCKSCPAETGDGSIPRILEAWSRRATIPARGVGVDTEDVARAIYDAMRFERKDNTPEWVRGGNSNAQVEARATASRILAAQPGADVEAQARELRENKIIIGMLEAVEHAKQAAQAREAALKEAIMRLRSAPLPENPEPGMWLGHNRAIALLEAMIGETCRPIGQPPMLHATTPAPPSK